MDEADNRIAVWPRATPYQECCLRLGSLSFDLAVPERYGRYKGPGTLVRHLDTMPGFLLEAWVLRVLQKNVFAGWVLLDALNYFTQALMVATGDYGTPFPAPGTKRRFTQAMGEVLVQFEVPRGWEMSVFDEINTAGFRGVAAVSRCHLSSSTTEQCHGTPRLIGFSWEWTHELCHFTVPCLFLPDLNFDGDDNVRSGLWSARPWDVYIPYIFIQGELQREWNEPLEFAPKPSEEEIYEMAEEAMEVPDDTEQEDDDQQS